LEQLTMTSVNAGPGDAAAFWFLGTEMRMKAAAASTGNMLGLIEQVAPSGFAAPPHIHHAEDEAFYVLSGSVTFHRGESVVEAAPGAFIWLPRDQPHWFEVHAGGPARLLQLNMPAGLEQFFAEMGTPMNDAPAPPRGEPDMERLLGLAQKYRIDLLPPPAR
jgi:quercetin dioxygenase-like cupin family protein